MNNLNLSEVKWGEIYLCDLGASKGSVQSGIRPVLVIQNNIGNEHSPTIVVATITSVLKKLNQPTHILLDTSCGLKELSMVMLEQVRTVDKTCELIEYIGIIEDEAIIFKIQQGILAEFNLINRPKSKKAITVLSLCTHCFSKITKNPNISLRRVDPLESEKERCDKCQLDYGYEYLILKKHHKKGNERWKNG